MPGPGGLPSRVPPPPPPPTTPNACAGNSCSSKILDQVTNNGNGIDKLNLALQGLDLALLKVIDNKLGPQLKNGGISGFLTSFLETFNNFASWSRLDRLLNILTFAATVQNHLMLSRDIGTTLLGAFTNILAFIGLKDSEGNPFQVANIINSTIETFVKSIVGPENYAELSAAWAKANRIYQATTNILNSFQSLTSTILSGLELIGSYTGKIGNALKKSGEVLENAYGWMNPQPKFNRVSQTLEKFQQGASTIQQVTQVPIDVTTALTGFTEANTEFVKALKEDDKPANKSQEIPEPTKLKADELASKLASRVSNILPEDFFSAAD